MPDRNALVMLGIALAVVGAIVVLVTRVDVLGWILFVVGILSVVFGLVPRGNRR